MARLKQSQREKKRYLAFEVVSKDKIDSFPAISNKIKECMNEKLGENISKLRIKMIEDRWNSELNRGIIRVNNRYEKTLRECLNKITINNEKIKSIGTSGMIKKAEARYLRGEKNG